MSGRLIEFTERERQQVKRRYGFTDEQVQQLEDVVIACGGEVSLDHVAYLTSQMVQWSNGDLPAPPEAAPRP